MASTNLPSHAHEPRPHSLDAPPLVVGSYDSRATMRTKRAELAFGRMTASAAENGDGASRSSDQRGWQWGPAAVVSVVIFVSLVALLRPGGPVGGDIPEGVVIDEPIQLVGAGELVQRFTASDDGLSSISLRFGTYGGNTRCQVVVSLVEPTAPEEPLARARLPCRDLPDSSLFEALDLRPVGNSGGRDYEARVAAVPSSEDFVAIWSGVTRDLPPTTLDGAPLQKSIELHTGYGDAPRGYDQLGVAMRRMSDFGAPWEQGVFLVGALLTAVVALVILAVRPPRRMVLVLVVLAVAKGILWSAVIPPLEGVDEHSHIAYAQYLGAQGRIPNFGDPLVADGLGPSQRRDLDCRRDVPAGRTPPVTAPISEPKQVKYGPPSRISTIDRTGQAPPAPTRRTSTQCRRSPSASRSVSMFGSASCACGASHLAR